jgi:WD40 repeat protein
MELRTTQTGETQTCDNTLWLILKMIRLLFCSALLFIFASALEHERSYFVQDGVSIVHSLALYQDSLLFTSSNDIVQKDIEAGQVQRSFRAHTNIVYGIIVTNDSRMISAGWDDMIIVWDMVSGSIIKRISLGVSNTYIVSISYQNGQVFTGGDDRKARQIDLNSGRVLRTISNSL